eukprot:8658288-Ditylum_brightwellii.AAC.1
MKLLAKKNNGDATKETSKAFIMSLLKDKDIEKTIRASVLSAKVKETKAMPALMSEAKARQAVKVKKELVSKKLISTGPYATPKRKVSISDIMQHSLNLPKNKTSGIVHLTYVVHAL